MYTHVHFLYFRNAIRRFACSVVCLHQSAWRASHTSMCDMRAVRGGETITWLHRTGYMLHIRDVSHTAAHTRATRDTVSTPHVEASHLIFQFQTSSNCLRNFAHCIPRTSKHISRKSKHNNPSLQFRNLQHMHHRSNQKPNMSNSRIRACTFDRRHFNQAVCNIMRALDIHIHHAASVVDAIRHARHCTESNFNHIEPWKTWRRTRWRDCQNPSNHKQIQHFCVTNHRPRKTNQVH